MAKRSWLPRNPNAPNHTDTLPFPSSPVCFSSAASDLTTAQLYAVGHRFLSIKMAEAQSDKIPSLSDQYSLEDEKKPDAVTKSVEVKDVEKPVPAEAEEVSSEKAEDSPATAEESTEVTLVATEASSEATPDSGESSEANSTAVEDGGEAATEASGENSEEEKTGDQDAAEETAEITVTKPRPLNYKFFILLPNCIIHSIFASYVLFL
ncbi:hypothetical protein I3843_15G042500 [Carya illinoinensis]|uniref:Uncharacterized protein n=1 Tax=Carya illinoinensis TaxID=32201 RepID=A0A922A3S0_CARIL|nr:hypothetical protein I3842_15G046500 [Carya illinoinensis]KAG7943497.1 hypothetical protein I3843_15G042500 [Carya illinoinensis]